MGHVEYLAECGQVVGAKRLCISPLGTALEEPARRDAIPGLFALASVCPDRGSDFAEPDLVAGFVFFFHIPPLVLVSKNRLRENSRNRGLRTPKESSNKNLSKNPVNR